MPLTIDIWSDVVCPWCYIGKRRLELALEKVKAPVEIRFHSFELDPAAPRDRANRKSTRLNSSH